MQERDIKFDLQEESIIEKTLYSDTSRHSLNYYNFDATPREDRKSTSSILKDLENQSRKLSSNQSISAAEINFGELENECAVPELIQTAQGGVQASMMKTIKPDEAPFGGQTENSFEEIDSFDMLGHEHGEDELEEMEDESPLRNNFMIQEEDAEHDQSASDLRKLGENPIHFRPDHPHNNFKYNFRTEQERVGAVPQEEELDFLADMTPSLASSVKTTSKASKHEPKEVKDSEMDFLADITPSLPSTVKTTSRDPKKDEGKTSSRGSKKTNGR
jgi:hypothetical protein